MHLYVHTQSYRSQNTCNERPLPSIPMSGVLDTQGVLFNTAPSTRNIPNWWPNGIGFGSRFWRDTHSFQFEPFPAFLAPHLILGWPISSNAMGSPFNVERACQRTRCPLKWGGIFLKQAWILQELSMAEHHWCHVPLNWTIEIMSQVGQKVGERQWFFTHLREEVCRTLRESEPPRIKRRTVCLEESYS